MPGVLITAEGRAIGGVVPQVTLTRVEPVRFVNCAFGPRINSASPAGGGVTLSRSAGKKPYWIPVLSFARSALGCRAGRPALCLSGSKTYPRPARYEGPAALKTCALI